MAAIWTNMASKMATNDKSNMAAVNNEYGRQYGRHDHKQDGLQNGHRKWGHYLLHSLLLFEQKSGEQTWRYAWVHQIVPNAFLTAMNLTKSPWICDYRRFCQNCPETHSYSKMMEPIRALAKSVLEGYQGGGGRLMKIFDQKTLACTNGADLWLKNNVFEEKCGGKMGMH